MLTVVAALIEHEGEVLACQRRCGERFELKWEFPGGKVQPGETLEVALARELEEELGVAAQIGAEVYRTQHQYAEMREPLELVFFSARVNVQQLRNLNFEEIRWCTPASLPELDFLAADRELIEKLAKGEVHLPRGECA
jgi:8-oxo-dGTP diphosphatase